MGHEPQLVDQVVLHQRLHERAAGVDEDVTVHDSLQLRDLLDDVALQDCGVGPFGGVFERRGHDEFGDAAQPVRPRARPGSPSLGEPRVGTSTDQPGCRIQRFLELDLGPLLAVLV